MDSRFRINLSERTFLWLNVLAVLKDTLMYTALLSKMRNKIKADAERIR